MLERFSQPKDCETVVELTYSSDAVKSALAHCFKLLHLLLHNFDRRLAASDIGGREIAGMAAFDGEFFGLLTHLGKVLGAILGQRLGDCKCRR